MEIVAAYFFREEFMVELLAPAGSYESLCAAVNAGADAVYIGGKSFGARAYADNPEEDELIRGIEYCHLHGRKLYLTVNTLLKEQELRTRLYPYLLPYYEQGIDGVIVQDLGVVRFIQAHFPGLDVHASTQMTVTGADGVRFLQEQGLTRMVLARELSLEEIRRIIDETGAEIETFIHGAMCYSYSGQCLFSSLLGGRSGNRGRCAQPCRLPYRVEGKTNPDSYILSMRDMCTLDLLPELIEAGIASLKIEGRMKRPEYTAGVVRIYRKYIDLYLKKGRSGFCVEESDRLELLDLYNRGGFSQGYYKQHNGKNMMAMNRPNHLGTQAAQVKGTANKKGVAQGKGAAKGQITAMALEDLHRQDVLELLPETDVTLGTDVKKGSSFTLSVRGKAPSVGSVIYRTKNESLLRTLHEQYVLKNCKEKIKGRLKIFDGEPAILELSCGNITTTVYGDCAQRAISNSTEEETVRRQMTKTGNTPFEFDSLQIEMAESLFVPIKELNELRRTGLEQLREAILGAGRRTAKLREASDEKCDAGSAAPGVSAAVSRDGYNMNVLVTTQQQLDAVLAEELPMLDTLYLDSMMITDRSVQWETVISGLHARRVQCFLNMPPVFRTREQSFFAQKSVQHLMVQFDGFLLHTVDELSFLKRFLQEKGCKSVLAADDSFYAYNTEAVRVLRESGVTRFTMPAELNFRELSVLTSEKNAHEASEMRYGQSELNVYGYQPLMQSAQCVQKNTGGCTKIPSVLYLKDRKNARFPVLNRCPFCCNTIYNSVALQLGGCKKEIAALAPSGVRLTFTVESGNETRSILQQYRQLLFDGDKAAGTGQEGTRGHFKRGVE